MKETTIKDIANISGVSISTVSRVINNNYPVRKEVKDRVLEVMKDLDYQPNAIARSLRMNRSQTVGLVIPDISNNFFMGIANGLESELAKMGYSLLIASSGGNYEQEAKLVNALFSKMVDALVIAVVDTDPEKYKPWISQGIPIVFVDRMLEGVKANQISWNNFETAYNLTEKLINNGHRKIGFINVRPNSNGIERLNGYKQALKDNDIDFNEAYVSRQNFSSKEAYESALNILKREDRPTALFCANNVMVDGLLEALNELHLKIYDDISIVSLGNLMCNKYIQPKITSAVLDSYEMGCKAGEILSDILDGTQDNTLQIRMQTMIKDYDSIRRI